MGARIFVAIWALVLTVLGVVFLTVGFALSAEDGKALAVLGGILLPIGVGLGALSLYLRSRQAAARKRRQEGKRTAAKVVMLVFIDGPASAQCSHLL